MHTEMSRRDRVISVRLCLKIAKNKSGVWGGQTGTICGSAMSSSLRVLYLSRSLLSRHNYTNHSTAHWYFNLT